MTRRTVETMKPKRLDELTASFDDLAIIMPPGDAEPPILSPAIRAAVHQWLTELQCVAELAEVGLTPRRSGLLSGPPGCGKTTLAHHFAARLGMDIAIVNMQTIVSAYLGGTGRNVDKLFRAARKHSRDCLLFLDEFDSLASARSGDGQSTGKERNAIVVAFLQQIDRFDGVFIAATNRGDAIDPALWRRFAMHLELIEPDCDCRFAILTRYLSPFGLPDAAMDRLCEATRGATPALLRQFMEGIKRDLVLGARFERPMDAAHVIARTMAAIRPHAEALTPPLWDDPNACIDNLAAIAWPPAREDKAA